MARLRLSYLPKKMPHARVFLFAPLYIALLPSAICSVRQCRPAAARGHPACRRAGRANDSADVTAGVEAGDWMGLITPALSGLSDLIGCFNNGFELRVHS